MGFMAVHCCLPVSNFQGEFMSVVGFLSSMNSSSTCPTFCSDLKNPSFVKSPANSVVDLYEQHVHDLGDVLDRHEPLLRIILRIGCMTLVFGSIC